MVALSDVDAYLGRIGLAAAGRRSGVDALHALHRAHVLSIPFENLDSSNGTPVSLEPAHLEDKLVARRRGGYCFEQNLLFKAALEALGFDDVTPVLARVRLGGGDHERPRTHLLLQVQLDGETWHADVGFGGDSLLAPIPWGPGPEIDQDGWRYRVVADGRELVLQMHANAGWEDQYGFVPERAPMIDIETSNWFVSTFPRSPFVTGLRVAKQEPGIRRALNVEGGTATFSEKTTVEERNRPVPLGEVPQLLAELFAVPGTKLDGDRVVL